MQTDDWQKLWSSKRLTELAEDVRRAAEGEAPEHPDAAVIRARLAAAGALTLAEGMAAIEVLRAAGDVDAGDHLAALLRHAAISGAIGWARAILEQEVEHDVGRASGHAGLAFLRDQLAGDRVVGESRALWELLKAPESKSAAELAEALDELLAERPSWMTPAHFARLAALWQAAHRFDRARAAWQASLSEWPEADGQGAARLERALCRWIEAEPERAREELIELRDDARADSESRDIARRLVATIEREAPSTSPSWVRARRRAGNTAPGLDSGRAARSHALALAGAPAVEPALADIDSFAALRFELERAELILLRLAVSEEVIARALEAGATVILGEERPLGAGFEIVAGLERGLQILELVRTDVPGSRLRWLDHQWDRSAFHGRSALLVCGQGEAGQAVAAALAGRGVVHDERFDLIDACDLDSSGNRPHGARVEGLTALATETAPEVPKVWQRRGSALLALFERGELDDDDNGDFQRWYAEARARFESAEWAHQLYAEALEYKDHHNEAGIAWSDAARLDDRDYRNYLGMARVRAATGLNAAAESAVNRALVLEPSSAPAWSLAARLALSRGDQVTAELASQLAASLAPTDPGIHIVRALVHEQADDYPRAVASLRRAHELRPEVPSALSRLCRRHIHAAAWDAAEAAATQLLETAPGYSSSWTLASRVAFACGDPERALALAKQGIGVVGPYADVVSSLATAFAATSDEPGAAADLVPMLAASGDAAFDVADALIAEGSFDGALAIYAAQQADNPGAVNPKWRQARAILRREVETGVRDSALVPLLVDITEKAGAFPYPRVLCGWLLADDDAEQALALLAEADADHDPALIWTALRHVLAKLERDDDVAELSARIQSLGAEGTLAAARTLADFGLIDSARHLIDSSSWIADDADRRLTAAMISFQAGDFVGAARQTCRALEESPERELDRFSARAAFRAGEWQLAKSWLEPICRRLARDSGGEFEDPWAWQSMLAVSRWAAGDGDALDSLLASAPRHPEVLRSVATAGRRLDDPRLVAAVGELAEVAPAWRAALDRPTPGRGEGASS